jgi:ABC-type transporter Mla maintaining outer membrane lipid asymmetry ATPase subunit MlaF
MSVISIQSVVKAYGGLRPLRLKRLEVVAGEVVGLAGFDKTTAEVFANLVMGATLPDEGTVRAFGRATSDIADSDEWLATLDRFGIVSERVVLLDQFTPLQNIAMALTLEVEPMPADVRAQAEGFGRESGLAAADFDLPLSGTTVAVRHRVRLARALAAAPRVLLVEHPVAGVDAGDIGPLADDLKRAAAGRQLAMVVLAAEPEHARPFAPRTLTLNGGTGELTGTGRGILKRMFGVG